LVTRQNAIGKRAGQRNKIRRKTLDFGDNGKTEEYRCRGANAYVPPLDEGDEPLSVPRLVV
jgi:hypothetical protein